MTRTLIPGGGPVPVLDLGALDDALTCASTALVHAWRGDQETASLSLLEAQAVAEEAFGHGSPGLDALNVVFAAISHAAALRTATNGRS